MTPLPSCCLSITEAVAKDQITFEAGTWNVFGCCGGNCYVLDNILCCPWCGQKLPT